VRTLLLQVLAEAGVFVRERAPAQRRASGPTPPSSHADLAVIVGDTSAEDLRVVRHAALVQGLPVVAVLPGTADAEAATRAGATGVALETDGITGLRQAVRRAIRAAGALRGVAQETPPQITVFGGLGLRQSPAALSGKATEVGLSQVEYQVLSDLVWARGGLVTREALEVHLHGAEHPISRGYLKAVIARIRLKARNAGGDPRLLTSIRGAGYALKG
ncbi:MAG: winged helix-turn-helix domain-containing protein, partial [Dehalococcoidia bacterium]